jgi:excinuclease ABC subunit A
MQQFIDIKGARVHNLKNLSVQIPHGKITVITGLSGSGKSSLAFDTIYAEGQRRYIESLSSYARQFLGKLNKPETDFIKGLSPAIAIEQKVISSNPRSTVGTTTEIYDYLKLLFAKVGKTYSPISGNEVKKHDVSDVLELLKSLPEGKKLLIAFPLVHFGKYNLKDYIEMLQKQGYQRIFINNKIENISDYQAYQNNINENSLLIIDRIINSTETTSINRFAESIQLAFNEGNGNCTIVNAETNDRYNFSNRFELDGMEFQIPNEHFFTFNNPFGACKVCEGYGMVIGIDENLVFPDKTLSVFSGAIAPWRGDSMGEYLSELVFNSKKFDFPIHRPLNELTDEQYNLLWSGNRYFTGLNEFFRFLESQTYKIQYRVLLSRYRGRTVCSSCKGTRLRSDTNYVKINNKSISDIVLMPIDECLLFFENLPTKNFEQRIVKRILPEIINRLSFLRDVGLGYLTLNRTSNTLSGGESQRINLATSIGSALVGSIYILDEPSIGLHPRDTDRLISVLERLKKLGNTVIIVEHEERIIQMADEILDIGPKAGIYGGTVVFQGNHKELKKAKNCITADFLNEKITIKIPQKKKSLNSFIEIKSAFKNNLKNVSVAIPMHCLVGISGVSGSGKSTLVKEILYNLIRKELGLIGDGDAGSAQLSGDFKSIKSVELIDQNPIGKSSRSNPITYVKAFDEIRELYSRQPLAKARNYKPGFFSFNIDGGRCEICEGEGEITVGMQFMADVHLACEACNGTRYKQETLEISYKGKSIADILEMDISTAFDFFYDVQDKLALKITDKIKPLIDVGLGYLKVGQSSSTLSGGEAQRIKLASFLSKGSQSPHTLFIFDEPTTGLHFHDIDKLLTAFYALINCGHSIVVIEHNTDVLKCVDHIIDIGPEGGKNGGQIVFSGKPEDLINEKDNWTAQYLASKFTR